MGQCENENKSEPNDTSLTNHPCPCIYSWRFCRAFVLKPVLRFEGEISCEAIVKRSGLLPLFSGRHRKSGTGHRKQANKPPLSHKSSLIYHSMLWCPSSVCPHSFLPSFMLGPRDGNKRCWPAAPVAKTSFRNTFRSALAGIGWKCTSTSTCVLTPPGPDSVPVGAPCLVTFMNVFEVVVDYYSALQLQGERKAFDVL